MVIALLAVSQSAFAQQRSGDVRVAGASATGTQQQESLYDGSYALIIGNSEYSAGWSRLSGVKADVAAVRTVLEQQGFRVEVEENLTSARFEDRIKKFINDYGYDRNHRLIIYYAGHGFTLSSAGDKRELGYIIPSDTPLPTKDERGFRQKAVSMYAVQTFAREIQAKHALFVFDSCFSGKLFALRNAFSNNAFIADKVNKPVRQFITAGDETQTVPDDSVFRRVFVRGLEGDADRNHDGYIVGTELADYLKEYVTRASSGNQTPQFGTILDFDLNGGDFVFSSPRDNSGSGGSTSSNGPSDNLGPAWSRLRDVAQRLAKYDFVGGFVSGVAPVRLRGKWGLVGPSGVLISPIKYDHTYQPTDGLARVTLNGKSGFVDSSGKEIVPAKYDKAFSFTDGLAAVKLGEMWGFIDKSGKVVVPFKYQEAYPYSEGLLPVKFNGLFGFIDITGRVVIPYQYTDVSNFSEGLAGVTSGYSYEFIDKSGNVVIPENDYWTTGIFTGGLVAVGVQDFKKERRVEGGSEVPFKYGFINRAGEVAVGIKYQQVQSFSEGFAAVVENGKLGFVNALGSEVIRPQYDMLNCDCDCDCELNPFLDSIAQVTRKGKYGFIDVTGKEIIPLNYDKVWCEAFRKEGFIGVVLNGRKGFVDTRGNEYFDF
jgi:uncharacterized caspase-like protein